MYKVYSLRNTQSYSTRTPHITFNLSTFYEAPNLIKTTRNPPFSNCSGITEDGTLKNVAMVLKIRSNFKGRRQPDNSKRTYIEELT